MKAIHKNYRTQFKITVSIKSNNTWMERNHQIWKSESCSHLPLLSSDTRHTDISISTKFNLYMKYPHWSINHKYMLISFITYKTCLQLYFTWGLVSMLNMCHHQAITQEQSINRHSIYHKDGDLPLHIKNILEIYIKYKRVLSNYKRPKDV
jgi:hypothetical protein